MIKVALFTTSRAEFGILSSLIREIQQQGSVDYLLFVGGSHLRKDQGQTIDEIHGFDFKISDTFDYLLDGDSEDTIAQSLSNAVHKVSSIFKNYDFDIIAILGDRIELLTIVIISLLYKKPIIHIHGGERTEGAIDEQVRHMVTKAAHLHFASCNEYARNIRRMGESSWRVFNTGALSIDSIINLPKIDKNTLFKNLKIKGDRPLAVATYHPVTLDLGTDIIEQVKNLFMALEKFDLEIIITAPGMEVDREQIDSSINEIVMKHDYYHYCKSLGIQKYYSLLPHCSFVIGNSSSGINEVPFFKIPTINVGSRQDGRLRHKSIIDTSYSVDSIASGINKALSKDFLRSIQNQIFKFGTGDAAIKMVEIIKNLNIDSKLLTKQLDFPE